jgi:hypothetical protein
VDRKTSRRDSLARNDAALASRSLKLLFGVVGGVVLMFDQKANPGKTCSLLRAKPLGMRKAAAKPMEMLLPSKDLACHGWMMLAKLELEAPSHALPWRQR